MVEKGESTEFFEDLSKDSEAHMSLNWEGTLEEYLEMVIKNPSLYRSSHCLLYEASTQRPNFFGSGPLALYGLDQAIDRLVSVLRAGAEGLDPRKRILLLVGPPGSGKSTLLLALKRGLEEYTCTEAGAIYSIEGCPMHEDPLNLMPEEMRHSLEEKYKIKVDGLLCPVCHLKFGHDYDKVRTAKVRRIYFSERDRMGIGTFQPSDGKIQNPTELIGSVDSSKLPEYGSTSDPLAYRFDGELNIANRGLMEYVELLKASNQMLYHLISLTTERVIKISRFANIFADEVIIGHTSEIEYSEFIRDPQNEALRDRMITVSIPYTLQVSEEIRIYDKLLGNGTATDRVHVAPNSLRTAAVFAVLTRLSDSKKGVSKIAKLKLYDGQDLVEMTSRDLKELHEEDPREGMDGISASFVIDLLTTAMIVGERECLTPVDALGALHDGLDNHPQTRDMNSEKKEQMRNLLNDARHQYDEMAKKEVQAAFIYAFSEQAQHSCDNYLNNIEAYLQHKKIKDRITAEEMEPDEKLMRAIEEAIGISESSKNEFRNEVLQKVASLALKNEKFNYLSHRSLKEAIEAKLFNDLKDSITISTSASHPDEEQLRKKNAAADRLIQEKGYCRICANEVIRYVGTLLNL